MQRKIELHITVTLRPLTKQEVEDNGDDWSEFKDDRIAAVEAVEPAELAEIIAGRFEDEYELREMLSGTDCLAAVEAVTVQPIKTKR